MLNRLRKQPSNRIPDRTGPIGLSLERRPFFTTEAGSVALKGDLLGLQQPDNMLQEHVLRGVCFFNPSGILEIRVSAMNTSQRTRAEDMSCVVTCSSALFLKTQEYWA